MSYPGNPSLSGAVKDRVLSTFQQSVTLYKQGRMDEVAAGCTLLLQMDPMFDPAKKLLEKMRNPASPIDVDSLIPTERDDRARMQQAREAMAGRDFQRVVQLTSDILTEDLLNDEARILGDEAREKIEAAPFVEQFARKADASLAAGNVAAAKMELEKARALDGGHPEVQRLAQSIAARGTGANRAAPSPSFVVDDRSGQTNAGGRSTQAADFGFTFEEEKTPPAADVSFANFSFDTPATSDSPFGGFSFDAKPSEKSAGSDFDFATASVSASDDDQKKIDQYLADGDRAYDAGDYSAAIDLWSRIFLIDVTNDHASERIERAKGKRREIEQKVENLLASGISSFDRGETAKAQTELSEVLRLDPRNSTAQDYLDRLTDSANSAARAASRAYIAPSPAPAMDIFDDELPMGTEAPLIPPDPDTMGTAPATKSGKQKTAAPAAATGASSSRKLPVALIGIVIAVLVLGAAGYFAWTKFSKEPEVAQTGEGDAIIGRATTLAAKGKYDQAIALLRDIKPGDPQHDKALVMIADLQQNKSSSAQLIDGVPAAQYYEQRLSAATTAFAGGDYSAAKVAFEQALRVQALPPDAKAQYDIASQKASQLDAAKALFAERKYADALTSLQPLLDQDPQNASIRRMIADAHFNMGAMALQEERLPDAIKEMDEVLKMNPGDELAKRSRDLATRYNGEPKDLLYKIYVKYLPLRAG